MQDLIIPTLFSAWKNSSEHITTIKPTSNVVVVGGGGGGGSDDNTPSSTFLFDLRTSISSTAQSATTTITTNAVVSLSSMTSPSSSTINDTRIKLDLQEKVDCNDSYITTGNNGKIATADSDTTITDSQSSKESTLLDCHDVIIEELDTIVDQSSSDHDRNSVSLPNVQHQHQHHQPRIIISDSSTSPSLPPPPAVNQPAPSLSNNFSQSPENITRGAGAGAAAVASAEELYDYAADLINDKSPKATTTTMPHSSSIDDEITDAKLNHHHHQHCFENFSGCNSYIMHHTDVEEEEEEEDPDTEGDEQQQQQQQSQKHLHANYLTSISNKFNRPRQKLKHLLSNNSTPNLSIHEDHMLKGGGNSSSSSGGGSGSGSFVVWNNRQQQSKPKFRFSVFGGPQKSLEECQQSNHNAEKSFFTRKPPRIRHVRRSLTLSIANGHSRKASLQETDTEEEDTLPLPPSNEAFRRADDASGIRRSWSYMEVRHLKSIFQWGKVGRRNSYACTDSQKEKQQMAVDSEMLNNALGRINEDPLKGGGGGYTLSEDSASLDDDTHPPIDLIEFQAQMEKATDTASRTLQMRKFIASEIYSTEKSYLRHLRTLKKIFMDPCFDAARKPPLINPADVPVIFAHILELILLSEKLVRDLDRVQPWRDSESRVGKVFLKFSKEFDVYRRYAENHQNSRAALKRADQNVLYRKFIQQSLRKKETNRLSLSDYLIMPIQRVTRYCILLQDLKKHTDPTQPDYADLSKALDETLSRASVCNNALHVT